MRYCVETHSGCAVDVDVCEGGYVVASLSMETGRDAEDFLQGMGEAFHDAWPCQAIAPVILYALDVDPQYRRRGLATQVMRRALARADRVGCDLLLLQARSVDGEMTDAQLAAFYARFGFVRCPGTGAFTYMYRIRPGVAVYTQPE